MRKMAEGLPGTLEFVQADLLVPGSFDDAVEGCEYIFHTASPFFFGGADVGEEQLIKPAVEGTTNVMNSVAKHKDAIKCVALTSSLAAVAGFTGTDKTSREDGRFSEADWNETSTIENGAYLLSKTLAEKAAWEIAEKEGFKLVVINPSLVLGPPNSDRIDGFSVEFGIKVLKEGIIETMGFPCVDVRDVAKAHIVACTHPNSEGRYICSSSFGCANWWIYEALADLGLENLQSPEKPEGAEVMQQVCNDKIQAKEAPGLGITLTPIETTIKDMITSMKVTHAKHL
jgi:nucleoside-diphosphate-sugar epimerase